VSATDDTDPDQDDGEAPLGAWRQGDCVLGDHWFAYRIDPANPLTEAARAAARDGADLAEASVAGFVIATQTCDIVKSQGDRDFVEVCPLVEVSETIYSDVRRKSRPRYAIVPALAARRLVADLDRTMTMEKPVVEEWVRVPGWKTHAEERAFAQALARKRSRPAFPDEFVEHIQDFQKRIKDKHNRESEEGRALRAIREIRVHAAPDWQATQISLTFWFIRLDDKMPQGLEKQVDSWLALVPVTDAFVAVDAHVVTLSEMTAAEYVDCDELDLDRLSSQ
jgi:hypothetical protein